MRTASPSTDTMRLAEPLVQPAGGVGGLDAEAEASESRRLEPRRPARSGGARRLAPLLALPVEVVLPAHGAPTDRAALERALS
jgi:hypothetical protein